MSLLPTAHAGQSFGGRRIDFYTVSGEVSASDDGTGRVTDTDGMSHDVRLLERSNALAPGDTASVLRVQAGPNRRSRPAAIVNHTRGTWMRAAPDATGLLARSGVIRGFNWWLSVLALALVGIAAVWPAIHGFLTEVNGGLMASVPAFDVFAEMQALLPGLAGWRLEAALPTGLLDTIASLGFVPMAQLTELGLAVAAGLVALLAFAGRSWRLIYIPALALLALATGTILGSPLATLAVIGGSLGFFMLGGLVNRIRDGGRFNARVARLAEHALRNPPHEGVRPSGGSDAAVAGVTASAAIAAATAAAHGDEPEAAAVEAEAAETVETVEADADTAAVDIADGSTADAASEDGNEADTISDAANASGEAEAPAQEDLLPAAPVAANDDATDSTEAAIPEDAGETEAAADVANMETEAVEAVSEPAPAMVEAEAEADTSDTVVASETVEASDDDATTGLPADTADTPEETTAVAASDSDASIDAGDDTDANTEVGPEVGIEAELDDDLPSLDDVAAAAALTAAETTAPAADIETSEPASGAAVDLDDERTMPVAPPPPMPGGDEVVTPSADTTGGPDSDGDAEPSAAASDDIGADQTALEPATAASDDSTAIIDDPLMDSADDPMMTSEGRSDYAPGAPEIDLDRTPAE